MDTMQKIGACQLGVKTDKKFLTGLIPEDWEEIVYEHNKFWSCKCKKDNKSKSLEWLEQEKEFNLICNNIIKEFDKHLMEIYSLTSNGIHFIVYLWKNQNK